MSTQQATYNITDDRLKVWFDRRLDAEEYALSKKIGFVFWHGSKCFTKKWTPEAEDFIAKFGIEVEDDDSPDDTELRVERFGKYAENAESHADATQHRLDSGAANTERRRRLSSSVLTNELAKAEYWNHRIQASIRHASFKERPDVIVRRIKGLETDIRRWEREAAEPSQNPKDRTVYQGEVSVWVGGNGRGGFWKLESEYPAMQAYARRWLEHLSNRLLYEQAMLAATDSFQAKLAEPDSVKIEVGGAIKYHSEWRFVTKVNKVTVEVYFPTRTWCPFCPVSMSDITDSASKLRVDAGEIIVAIPPVVEKAPKAKTMTRDGKFPEKFGAVGILPVFSFKIEEVRWCLITKVNQSTVEITYTDTMSSRVRFLKKKEDIRSIFFLKSAEQVKAENPQILAEWKDFLASKEVKYSE